MARIHWLDILIAPLTWLERARTWPRRLALLAVYFVVVPAVAVLIGREVVLWPIPDVPEPFDLAQYGHVEVADADNAMVLYRLAFNQLVASDKLSAGAAAGKGDQWDWVQAEPQVREWVEANGAAGDLWLQGTARPDCLAVQPAEVGNQDPTINRLVHLHQLATLRATRLGADGDLAGAWAWHRGLIRSALHSTRHAGVARSVEGWGHMWRILPKLRAWADDPEQSADLLRGAVADLGQCRQLAATTGEIARAEYFAERWVLANAGTWLRWDRDPAEPKAWYHKFPPAILGRTFLRNEPKRSLKILRLVTAGILAQADRPRGERPALVSPRAMVYALDATTPPGLTRISPEALVAWVDASGCSPLLADYGTFMGWVDAGASQLDRLRVHMAKRAYQLDHAGQPAPTYGALVPTYIDALPAGFGPSDPLAAP